MPAAAIMAVMEKALEDPAGWLPAHDAQDQDLI